MLNERARASVITGNPQDLIDAGVPPHIPVTWELLGAYFDSLPLLTKRAITTSEPDATPAKDMVRMLWLCYRESPDFAADFPDEFAALQLKY